MRTRDLRHPHDRRGPHPTVSAAAALAATAALWPSGLPRPATVSAAVTAGCVAVITACALMATRRSSARPATIVAAAAASLGFTCCAALLSMSWQNGLRRDLIAPAVGPGWAAMSVGGALLAFVATVWLPRISALMLATTLALIAGGLPGAQADRPADPTPDIPAGIFYGRNDEGSTRRGDTSALRSAEIVARWVRAGGLERRAVVIAVPTGSGWVDAAAVSGYRRRFAGDVAVVAMQYSARPSWQTFAADRSAAGATATALLREVLDRIGVRPPSRRPEVYLYGQSLGAVGADAAREWADRWRTGALTETTLVGVPGDTVATLAGAGSRRVIVANDSDPIPRWSLSTLWRAPRRPADTRVVGHHPPQPLWLPVIGFLQTSVDLLGSLDGAPGVGHRYGPEQTTGSPSS